jgi:hypothetical protein
MGEIEECKWKAREKEAEKGEIEKKPPKCK